MPLHSARVTTRNSEAGIANANRPVRSAERARHFRSSSTVVALQNRPNSQKPIAENRHSSQHKAISPNSSRVVTKTAGAANPELLCENLKKYHRKNPTLPKYVAHATKHAPGRILENW